MMKRRFGVSVASGEACVGFGEMHEISRGPWWTVPFLQLGRVRNILVPEIGTRIPFTVENYPYVDPYGRETLTFVRKYGVGSKSRRFDASMVWSSNRILDYLGTHQHLAVDLQVEVDQSGALVIESSGQRFREGVVDVRVPAAITGRAHLREYFDPTDNKFHVELEVTNSRLGFLFGYRGDFTCEWVRAAPTPQDLLPRRHERRT